MRNLNKINPEAKIILSDAQMKNVSGRGSGEECTYCGGARCLGLACDAGGPGVCYHIEGSTDTYCHPTRP